MRGDGGGTLGGTRVERFLAHLDGLTPGMEPRFLPVNPTSPRLNGVVAITYSDLPESGFLTTVTYGLSLADHPSWRLGKPELCISVRSQDDRWARAAAYLAEQLRGRCPFTFAETIDFGEPVSPESPMSSFVVFAPAVLDRARYLRIDVGDPLPININGLYPIHDDERLWIREYGLEGLLEARLGYVRRPTRLSGCVLGRL
jgi:hypothetical protein